MPAITSPRSSVRAYILPLGFRRSIGRFARVKAERDYLVLVAEVEREVRERFSQLVEFKRAEILALEIVQCEYDRLVRDIISQPDRFALVVAKHGIERDLRIEVLVEYDI